MLGVHWCIETDTLQFWIELKDKLLSRGILSTVSSIYDPLGLLAPVILQGKRILQELCRDGVGWDDKVPEDIRPRWERRCSELTTLEKLKVPRCHKPNEFGEIKTLEFQHSSKKISHLCRKSSIGDLQQVIARTVALHRNERKPG